MESIQLLFIIIVAAQPNGYFVWNGTTLYLPGQTLPSAPGTVTPAVSAVWAWENSR